MKYLYNKKDLKDKKDKLTAWYTEIYNMLNAPLEQIPREGTTAYDEGRIIDKDDLDIKLSQVKVIVDKISKIKPIRRLENE
jgi:hypothetical protein